MIVILTVKDCKTATVKNY